MIKAGDKFGRWTVLREDENNKNKVICQCDCGKVKSVWITNLTRNKSSSCGCQPREKTIKRCTIHGGTRTRLYWVWSNMRRRCYEPKNNRYQNYGGKGIKVCDEWLDFACFREWALSTGYNEDAKYGECTIERIDVNGDYCPKNCTWKSIQEQNFNRTSNRRLTYKGKTQTVTEWGKEKGFNDYIISNRLRRGWTVEEALEIPVGGRRCTHLNKLTS